jgi:hypothetical protein
MKENEMTTERVKALRDFSNAAGSRSEGDQFDYDMRADPFDLKKLGIVEAVQTEKKKGE